MPEIQIVTHPLCPHGQRLVLAGLLGGKKPNVDYKLKYLPYATLQASASLYSPTGELPVLFLDDVGASTRTDAIAEYFDGVFGLGLLPRDPHARLRIRAGERLVATSLDRLRDLFTARDRQALDAAYAAFFDSLGDIEPWLDANDDPTALAHLGHVALAPIGSLASHFEPLWEHGRWQALPIVRARLGASSAHPLVVEAKCSNYAAEFDAFFEMTGSAFPKLTAGR